jgi:hypothetical protein
LFTPSHTIQGNLGVNGNWLLTSMSLPQLATIGGNVTVSQNSALEDCIVETLVAQLLDFTGTTTITDNAATSSCP